MMTKINALWIVPALISGIAIGFSSKIEGPFPPSSLALASIAHLDPPRCDDKRVNRLVAAAQDINQWHKQNHHWYVSNKYNLQLYGYSSTIVQVGNADKDLLEIKEPDVSPVCR